MRARLRLLVTAAAASLALAPLAAADKEQIDLTAAGQADARAATVQRADLGNAAVWTGGPKKPSLDQSFGACNYRPKQSDLVLIGAAESDYKTPGLEFDTNTQVLKTAAMVALDWQRSVTAPQVLPCVRATIAKAAKAPERVASFERISFPQLTEYASAYRVVLDIRASSGRTAAAMIDFVLIGRGRTEISLTTTAPYADRAPVSAAELRLAELLITRIRS
jgi:hypothetical protein